MLAAVMELALLRREGESVSRVSDTGPGILESEREALTKRFLSLRQKPAHRRVGLGLRLVAAIVKLHGFRFTIAAGPSCTAEIALPASR
jgi:K+-sensing histidine kinase KdpD